MMKTFYSLKLQRIEFNFLKVVFRRSINLFYHFYFFFIHFEKKEMMLAEKNLQNIIINLFP